jgi:hypothetical protein
MKASMLRVSGRSSGQAQSNHWQKIIEGLDKLLKILQDNHVRFSFVVPVQFACARCMLKFVLFILRYPWF